MAGHRSVIIKSLFKSLCVTRCGFKYPFFSHDPMITDFQRKLFMNPFRFCLCFKIQYIYGALLALLINSMQNRGLYQQVRASQIAYDELGLSVALGVNRIIRCDEAKHCLILDTTPQEQEDLGEASEAVAKKAEVFWKIKREHNFSKEEYQTSDEKKEQQLTKPNPPSPKQIKKKKKDPFAAPFEQGQLVSTEFEHHNVLLNKFRLVNNHFLLVSKEFDSQLNHINARDLATIYQICSTHRVDVMAYYNRSSYHLSYTYLSFFLP